MVLTTVHHSNFTMVLTVAHYSSLWFFTIVHINCKLACCRLDDSWLYPHIFAENNSHDAYGMRPTGSALSHSPAAFIKQKKIQSNNDEWIYANSIWSSNFEHRSLNTLFNEAPLMLFVGKDSSLNNLHSIISAKEPFPEESSSPFDNWI